MALIYGLATLMPWIAVIVRRLHDTGRRGAWIFVGLIPLVGVIIMIVLLAERGDPDENKYGPNPIAEATKAEARVAPQGIPGVSPRAADPFSAWIAKPPAEPPAAPPPEVKPDQSASQQAAQRSPEDRLAKLKSLHDSGVITNDEYEDQRKAIISEL